MVLKYLNIAIYEIFFVMNGEKIFRLLLIGLILSFGLRKGYELYLEGGTISDSLIEAMFFIVGLPVLYFASNFVFELPNKLIDLMRVFPKAQKVALFIKNNFLPLFLIAVPVWIVIWAILAVLGIVK